MSKRSMARGFHHLGQTEGESRHPLPSSEYTPRARIAPGRHPAVQLCDGGRMPVRGQSTQKRTFSAKTSAVPPLSAVAIREASLPAAATAALHVEAELHRAASQIGVSCSVQSLGAPCSSRQQEARPVAQIG
jgi:hypothetical protein